MQEDKVVELKADAQKAMDLEIHTMDMDRVRFLLRSYLRSRLLKVLEGFCVSAHLRLGVAAHTRHIPIVGLTQMVCVMGRLTITSSS